MAALAQSNWQPAVLPGQAAAQTAATQTAAVVDTAWSATVPDGLEGYYTVRARGSDTAGNFDEEPTEAWSGLVDTLAPRVSLSVVQNGATTQYTFTASDFSLNKLSFEEPAACGGTGTTTETLYSESWYRALHNQNGEVTAEPLYSYRRYVRWRRRWQPLSTL
jgi:hypothetical protein